ncbi:MAG: IS91 family transposase [Beggiatoa sp.]|nr:IS91 family transposase [Beggiatoa sp.]
MCGSAPPGTGVGRVELAQIFREYGEAYRSTHPLCAQQRRVMQAIEDCRTAALGGHLEVCDHCGAEVARYHSCRNRHCPKCQTLAKERWVEARCAELLPVPYFHLVFPLPHEINSLAQGNPKVIYGLLFQAASETLQSFGRDPKWLGGEIGITMVLHTWGQNLSQHLHVHCVVSGGALAPDGRWIPAKRGFLFPVRALSVVFRAKYLEALKGAFETGKLDFAGDTLPLAVPSVFGTFLTKLRAKDWVVYAKRPFGGPEEVLAYLGRYTHRIAIGNERLLGCENGEVHFRWRDYAHGNKVKVMRLPVEEFIRRFLLHVLPKGFMRIRHYGLLANRHRTEHLAACRVALDAPTPAPAEPETVEAFLSRVLGTDANRCPHCGQGRLRPVSLLPPLPRATGPPRFRWAA